MLVVCAVTTDSTRVGTVACPARLVDTVDLGESERAFTVLSAKSRRPKVVRSVATAPQDGIRMSKDRATANIVKQGNGQQLAVMHSQTAATARRGSTIIST